MASFSGVAKGVYLKPTSAIRLLLLIISAICKGAPKSLSFLSWKGFKVNILNPLLVATAIQE
jgi:hypothetical protein